MRLTVLGCSGSYAGPASPASAYLLRADHDGRTWSIVLDLGNGALGPLQRFVDPGELDAVLISHLHPDHCADMSGLFVTRKYRPGGATGLRLPVYGPAGTAERLTAAYGDVGPREMDDHFDLRRVTEGLCWRIGPFEVSAHRMNHPVECYGYRVTADGATVAYTGDTDSTPNLVPLLSGADLALMDCAFVDGRDALRDVHLSGSRAAQAALDAGGVGRLMLTHLPAWNDPEVCRAQASTIWPGTVELAEPGATYLLGEPGGDPVEGRPRLLHTVLDTTDVRGLAEFYRQLLGLVYRPGDEPPTSPGQPDERDWLVLTEADGTRRLAFQQVTALAPTTWPDPEVPMQLHVDFVVSTREALEVAKDRALALGARLVLDRTGDAAEPLYVLADPAGHPFCVFLA